ncbi:MAG TPA: hypothetical protein VJU61_19195, partial [Polyangiaceae bacterium]|nr:hypothetical protein [Polyangiaceae bacterium]
VGCPADDACRNYSDTPVVAGPDAGCLTLADCPFTWKPAAREGQACRCDDSGCLLLAGAACTASSACDGASCLATADGSNVCCAQACQENEVCTADGSGCVPAEPCSEGSKRCSGALHQSCVGSVWQTLTDCGTLGCSTEFDGCLHSAGQACAADVECGEGSCRATAEGNQVCCTGACAASCQRCSAEGTACADLEDDEACGTIECPSDPCRVYDPATVVTNRCSAGQCQTAAEACTVFLPQRVDQECSATALCDEAGNCNRPKRPLLAACSSNSQCENAACVATAAGTSVCCSRLCAASEVCGPTGACVPAPVCETGAVQCSGSSFQRCVGGQWATELACGTLGCSASRGGCLAGPGQACTSSADCGAGTCQDTAAGGRVCCTAACDGSCRVCAASGTVCTNLPDDAACGAIDCPDDTACRDFPPSVTAQRCIAGACGTAAQLCRGNARAVGQSCSTTNLCDNAGNCATPKKANGQACGASSECAGNNCVDGVCCGSACNGVCETCAGTGICRAAATDTACGTVSCSGFSPDCVTNTMNFPPNACSGRGQCRSSADCGFEPSTTRCGQGGVCNGQGVCQGPSVRCGNQTCSGNNVCCSMININSTSTQPLLACGNGQTCTFPGNPVGPIMRISCDQNADCTGSQVCCIVSGNTNSGDVTCRDDCTADAVGEELNAPPSMLVVGQVCASPAGQIFLQCPGDTDCVPAVSTLPGTFSMCR